MNVVFWGGYFWSQGTKLGDMSKDGMLKAKQLGYSDIQIAQRTGATENEVRSFCTVSGYHIIYLYLFLGFISYTCTVSGYHVAIVVLLLCIISYSCTVSMYHISCNCAVSADHIISLYRFCVSYHVLVPLLCIISCNCTVSAYHIIYLSHC